MFLQNNALDNLNKQVLEFWTKPQGELLNFQEKNEKLTKQIQEDLKDLPQKINDYVKGQSEKIQNFNQKLAEIVTKEPINWDSVYQHNLKFISEEIALHSEEVIKSLQKTNEAFLTVNPQKKNK